MKSPNYGWLVAGALYELVRYEVVLALRGFGGVQRQVGGQSVAACEVSDETEKVVCDAVLLATCLYWKPVLCLQRSVCLVRLLRRHGVFGRLVIGYRPAPFFSHAWAEVGGRVVNSSAGYQRRLRVLYTV
jgi:hypothetical protein